MDLTDCPRSRDRDRRHAAQRHRRDRRCCPARLPRRLAGRRARHAVRVGRAAAGLAVGHADGRPRSTPGSTSRPTTASASPARLPRPGPWPPSHAGPTVRPPLAREQRGQQVRMWLERRCGRRAIHPRVLTSPSQDRYSPGAMSEIAQAIANRQSAIDHLQAVRPRSTPTRAPRDLAGTGPWVT